MTTPGKPIPRRGLRRVRRTWIWGAVLLGLLVFAYVVTLPMRQAPFSLRDHAIVRQGQEAAIEGVLENRGAEAPAVRIEAYLYDRDRRYLATLEQTYRDVPARSATPIRLPIEPALIARVERYSLYAGVGPNPFAPD